VTLLQISQAGRRGEQTWLQVLSLQSQRNTYAVTLTDNQRGQDWIKAMSNNVNISDLYQLSGVNSAGNGSKKGLFLTNGQLCTDKYAHIHLGAPRLVTHQNPVCPAFQLDQHQLAWPNTKNASRLLYSGKQPERPGLMSLWLRLCFDRAARVLVRKREGGTWYGGRGWPSGMPSVYTANTILTEFPCRADLSRYGVCSMTQGPSRLTKTRQCHSSLWLASRWLTLAR
jgi:hypothetical protein